MTTADRMAVLDQGVVQQVGTMNALPVLQAGEAVLQVDEPHHARQPQRAVGTHVAVGLALSEARLLPR